MDATILASLIEDLDDNIDDLEEALAPLIKSALSDTAGKLPVLDRAKLYVIVAYAIESILFSYLRLNGVDAKEHQVFRELTRIKQYFEKIKIAESGEEKRENMSLDKAATRRILNHALASTEQYDQRRARRQNKPKASKHIKFEQPSEQLSQKPLSKRKADVKPTASDADGVTDVVSNSPDSDSRRDGSGVDAITPKKEVRRSKKGAKKQKVQTSSP